jgi:hypothetical protein
MYKTVFYELEASNNEKTGMFLDSVGIPSNETTFFRVNKCVVYRNKERGLDVRANASVSLTECLIQENEHTGVPSAMLLLNVLFTILISNFDLSSRLRTM